MRLYELFESQINNKMKADITGLLLSLKAENIKEIPTKTLVRDINNLGYSMTVDDIVSMSDQFGLISSADGNVVNISFGDEQGDDVVDVENTEMTDQQVDDMVVKDMAKKGLEK